jgi:hypothetical protein
LTRVSLVVILLTLLCVSANAGPIIIQAESYVASHDEGGLEINVVDCSGAGGGQAVEGFDFPGDWIEIILIVDENESFSDNLRSGGDLGQESELRSTVFGAGPLGEDLVSTFNTVGLGIG